MGVFPQIPRSQLKYEWSEEERKILDSIIDDYEAASKSFCGYDGKIGLLRAIRNGEYDLPKQEWSEEDKKILNELLDHCNTENATWYNWLKSLSPQPKKNDMITPNKEFFQWIYDRLVNVHNEDPNVDYMISFKKRIEESSWKPSEEQMRAFKKYIEEFQARSEAAVGGWNNFDVMIRLYEQLKKL